ncbi:MULTISPECIES: S9 family peptidase [unclassified Massilia]|uniref:alpha/beta hydrolase family protein n=1 Tax=unclassified Massilia TaxID=2609279 RepID=UPI00177DF93E|nr:MULTISPECIES: S9 family peptidase [unclassified Massilia]MBD8532445.1 S9 family peptidase [Massilia sp. CFBP 13647]MBD8675815.1 S9 family peptidase [Massilia sp. CFBP 13721]
MFVRSAVLCGLLLSSQPVFSAPSVPLSAFVHEDQYSKPRLAPDGKHIAITARVALNDRFVPVVMVYKLPEMKQTGAIRMPLFEVPLDYQWVSPTRLAIAKGREFGSREAPMGTGEVLSAELDGSKSQYLFGYKMFLSSSRGDRYGDDYAYGYIEAVSRKRDGHLFLTSHAWEGNHSLLYDIDSNKATRRLMADLPMPDLEFVLQQDGKPRFASGVDDQSHAVLFRLDDASGRWNKLPGDKVRRYEPFQFSTDGKDFVATYSADGEPDKLVRENLETGKRTVLFEDPVGSFTGAMYGTSAMPFAARSTVGLPRVRYFDENNPDSVLHKQLSAQFPGQYLHFIDVTDDKNLILFSVRSDRDPGSYYLFDRTAMKADMLFSAMESIDPEQMAERRPISLKARDGLALHGFLTMPAHAKDAKVPLVVLPHGGPHGIYDAWFFEEDAQFLASRGYAVLQLNFRGSGGRGVDFLEAGYRQWAGKMIDDLVDATRWAIAQGEVDGARVCSYGASYGGYAAMMLAAREPDLYKCAVGYVGAYDLKLLAKPSNNRHDTVRASFYRKYVGDDREELTRNSPIAQAARIKSPVLLVHGGNDKITPVEHAESMRAALIAAGRPPEWFLAPNEGHGFYDTANRTAFYEKLEAFLGKHIGTAAAH